MRRFYTVEDATRTLPYVQSIVGEVRERYKALRDKGRTHNEVPPEKERQRADLKEDIRHQASRLRGCQEELLQLGIILKDYELGLVDFPAELEGRPILLCWEWGEEEVGFWHEASDGYLGRRPVPQDCPAWPEAATVSPAAPE